jgi:hypothetical protein
MVSFKGILPVMILAAAALPACADSISVVANGSISSHAGEGGNGFYMSTYADSSVLQAFGSGQVGDYASVLDFPEFTLPTGAVVTSATLDVSFDPLVQETTPGTYSEGPESVDHAHSYVAGAIDETVSTTTSLGSLLGHSLTTNADCQLNNTGNSTNLVATGFGPCLAGTEDYLLQLSSLTTVTADLVSSGFNSWEIFNFGGGNTVDVSADLSIDYTVTPEPSGVVLLGTGLLALLAAAWYRRAANC